MSDVHLPHIQGPSSTIFATVSSCVAVVELELSCRVAGAGLGRAGPVTVTLLTQSGATALAGAAGALLQRRPVSSSLS